MMAIKLSSSNISYSNNAIIIYFISKNKDMIWAEVK
jgi:hypothetical protein